MSIRFGAQTLLQFGWLRGHGGGVQDALRIVQPRSQLLEIPLALQKACDVLLRIVGIFQPACDEELSAVTLLENLLDALSAQTMQGLFRSQDVQRHLHTVLVVIRVHVFHAMHAAQRQADRILTALEADAVILRTLGPVANEPKTAPAQGENVGDRQTG